ARVCHEANRVLQAINGEPVNPPWDEAPEWMQASTLNGVENILDNDATPEESHQNWMRERAAAGWIYGPVKDEAALTHPCMVPYDELPLEQQLKDHLFHSI